MRSLFSINFIISANRIDSSVAQWLLGYRSLCTRVSGFLLINITDRMIKRSRLGLGLGLGLWPSASTEYARYSVVVQARPFNKASGWNVGQVSSTKRDSSCSNVAIFSTTTTFFFFFFF